MKQILTSFRILGNIAPPTISKRVPVVWLLWGILGIGSVLLFSVGTIASPNATASNGDDASLGQVTRKAPSGMVWIPRGTFLMGSNEKGEFS
jgi:hypothetical protein